MQVPLESGDGPRMDLKSNGDRISLVVRDAPVGTVLALIAQQQGLNVVSSQSIDTVVSVTLQDVRLDQALSTLLSIAGYTWVRQEDIIVVTPVESASRLAPQLQGRVVRVFPLDFVAAVDVEKVVQGLLSAAGTAQIVESSNLDRRRTQESIIVEDLPQYVARVEEYVRRVDVPPRQVLIEAYILQVELTDNLRHGVNFRYLTEIAGSDVSLSTIGFANPLASPAFFLQIDGGDLDALLEALKSTTETRTLASPKVLAVNGQDARIQIGQRLGYFVTTTTETSTLQNVDFLDLGVVLTVTPTIGTDNRILMNVRPQVSSGQINPETGLPEEDTTEVESTVMLDDGQAMIIGGLIQEEDLESQQKIPLIGDLRLVGRLFQRRTMNRRRSEVIVCLVPRIVPMCGPVAARELHQVERATSPVLTPDLRRARRDFEPLLPDATRNPRTLDVGRIPDAACNLFDPVPYPPEYYFPRTFGPTHELSIPTEP